MKSWAWLRDRTTTTIVLPYLKMFYSFFVLFFTGPCKFLYFVPVSLSFMPRWLLPVLMIKQVDGPSSTLRDYYAIQTFLFCCEADIYQTGCAFKVASLHFTTKTSVDIVLVNLLFWASKTFTLSILKQYFEQSKFWTDRFGVGLTLILYFLCKTLIIAFSSFHCCYDFFLCN